MISTHSGPKPMLMSSSRIKSGGQSQDHRLQGHLWRPLELFWQSGSQVRLTRGTLRITHNLGSSQQNAEKLVGTGVVPRI